jgi:hypothetical protein
MFQEGEHGFEEVVPKVPISFRQLCFIKNKHCLFVLDPPHHFEIFIPAGLTQLAQPPLNPNHICGRLLLVDMVDRLVQQAMSFCLQESHEPDRGQAAFLQNPMSCEYLNEPMQIQHQCNAETVSLQQQPVVRIYVSQEKTGID